MSRTRTLKGLKSRVCEEEARVMRRGRKCEDSSWTMRTDWGRMRKTLARWAPQRTQTQPYLERRLLKVVGAGVIGPDRVLDRQQVADDVEDERDDLLVSFLPLPGHIVQHGSSRRNEGRTDPDAFARQGTSKPMSLSRKTPDRRMTALYSS